MKNKEERKKMVVAMDYIVRSMNDEDDIIPWLSLGVPDGDINHATDWEVTGYTDDYFEEDDNLAELMGLFLKLMRRANANGGLYCDGILSDDIIRIITQ